MIFQYEWRVDKYPVDAQSAGEFIEGIVEECGEATPQRVLDKSRDEDALLHPCFEWHDHIAAEKYRLSQSKELIGNLVTVSIEEGNGAPTQTRAFVSVTPGKGRARYKPILSALEDEEERQIILANAKADAASFARKYSALQEFSKVITEIHKVID